MKAGPASEIGYAVFPCTFSLRLVAIGDVKGRRRSASAEFSDDEIGKVISFLQDLLCSRPDRPAATGFLTDSFIIQFIRLRILRLGVRVDYEVDVTRPYYLRRAGREPCGGDWLHTLLSEKPHVLGCPTTELSVDGSIVEITRYLGEGSSSVVWQGKHNQSAVVVKVFRAGHEHDLEAEIRNLAAVQGLVGVTKYAASDTSSSVLLLSPVGTPFSPHGQGGGTMLPSAEHFAQLIGIIQAAHDKQINLLHRDLSWANFFLGPDGKVRDATCLHTPLTALLRCFLTTGLLPFRSARRVASLARSTLQQTRFLLYIPSRLWASPATTSR